MIFYRVPFISLLLRDKYINHRKLCILFARSQVDPGGQRLHGSARIKDFYEPHSPQHLEVAVQRQLPRALK